MEGIFNFWFWSKGHLLNPLSAPMGAGGKKRNTIPLPAAAKKTGPMPTP